MLADNSDWMHGELRWNRCQPVFVPRNESVALRPYWFSSAVERLHNNLTSTMTLVLISAIHEAAPDRPAGYADEVLAAGTTVTTPDGDFVEIPDEVYDTLAAKYSGRLAVKGPGSVLHRALETIGIEALPSCPCLKRKAIMDQWGWAECQKPERLDEITGWMEEEATIRGLLFFRPAARMALATGLAAGALVYGGNSKPSPPEA